MKILYVLKLILTFFNKFIVNYPFYCFFKKKPATEMNFIRNRQLTIF